MDGWMVSEGELDVILTAKERLTCPHLQFAEWRASSRYQLALVIDFDNDPHRIESTSSSNSVDDRPREVKNQDDDAIPRISVIGNQS